MPATSMAIVLLLTLVSLLVMEPDFGQTMLILMVWGALFFIAGMRMIWVAGLAGAAAAGLFGAYLLVPHVAGRIKRFMNPASGDTFQVDMAMEAFWNGGWFGLGPGEGIAKRSLPDSHTDFVFAVAAEEFGIILCLALVALFAFVVIRTLTRAYSSEDMFARFAASGLAILFGVQAAINMAVNLQLIPAKGMTLPFISYGGSSIISLAYGVGMMLALTRQRPRTEVEFDERGRRVARLRLTARYRGDGGSPCAPAELPRSHAGFAKHAWRALVAMSAMNHDNASHSTRRRRHRRSSVSRRGAGRRAHQARPARASGNRRPRTAATAACSPGIISTWCRARPCAAAR